jgi:hypothetical protein
VTKRIFWESDVLLPENTVSSNLKESGRKYNHLKAHGKPTAKRDNHFSKIPKMIKHDFFGKILKEINI